MNELAQPNWPDRLRGWFTIHHFAQLALLVQPLIVARTAGEYIRLSAAGTVDPALIEPLFISLAAVGVVTIVSLLLYFARRERTVLLLTLIGIIALVAYKMLAMPGLG